MVVTLPRRSSIPFAVRGGSRSTRARTPSCIRRPRGYPSGSRARVVSTTRARGQSSGSSSSTHAVASSFAARSWPASPADSVRRTGVHSGCRVGADLPDGDPEDPHRVPLLGRLVGGQGGAEAGGGRGGSRPRSASARATAPAAPPRPDHTRPLARRPGAPVRAQQARRRGVRTAIIRLVEADVPERAPSGATQTLAGFLAAAGIFVSLAGVAYRPLRLIPFAIVLSLIAVAIG